MSDEIRDKIRDDMVKKVTAEIDEILNGAESEIALWLMKAEIAKLACELALRESKQVKEKFEIYPPEGWGHLSAAMIILEGTLASLNEEE